MMKIFYYEIESIQIDQVFKVVVFNIYQKKTLKLNQKKTIGLKKEYIDSKAQKKTNKITKFLINAFLWNVASTLIKMHWPKI